MSVRWESENGKRKSKMQHLNLIDLLLPAWVAGGVGLAVLHAGGVELAKIESRWQRQLAVLLCAPCLLGVYVVMYGINMLGEFFRNLKDAWDGKGVEDRVEALRVKVAKLERKNEYLQELLSASNKGKSE